MEKPFNLKVIEIKSEILKVIQEAQLPAVVTQMVLREIVGAVDMQVQNILQNEKQEYEKANESNND